MATKKQDNEMGEAIIWLIGITAFLPFIVFAVLKYSQIKREYMQGENFRRIIDINTLKSPLITFGAFAYFAYIVLAISYENHPFLAVLLFCAIAYLGMKLSKWVAVKYVGAIIDEGKDIVVFPPDMQSYEISDYFKLKFLKDMSQVDTVNISSIEKMTRQAGKHLYLQGPFGSRKISFSTKQKRDECMSAIQQAARKKGVLMYELEQSGDE